ncbi:MAG: HAMP domain-containing protein [Candidatus Sericytochromatia bacterium]|nr:HAMP domain-containing protein [Candidatus Sericytochromatia bacterium]
MANKLRFLPRKTYFIKHGLQSRYALVFVLAIGIGLNIGVTLTLLSPFVQSSIPSFPVIYFAVVLLFLFIVAAASIMFTHRVAGPIYRFEQTIRQIVEDYNLDIRVKLRQGDEMQELAHEFNYLLDRLREAVVLDRRNVRQAIVQIDEAMTQLKGQDFEGISDCTNRLYMARKCIQNIATTYKIT